MVSTVIPEHSVLAQEATRDVEENTTTRALGGKSPNSGPFQRKLCEYWGLLIGIIKVLGTMRYNHITEPGRKLVFFHVSFRILLDSSGSKPETQNQTCVKARHL